jgi:hypothetical protein
MSHFINDDYAGVRGDGFLFYYGYEVEVDDKWCFQAKFDDKIITIPWDELTKNQWECVENLMAGIATIFETYKLTEKCHTLA